MAGETILRLYGADLPPYASRGIKEKLTPIGGDMRRTINGSLVDVMAEQMRKYRVSLSATDQDPPALENVWPGSVIIVECITELCMLGDTVGQLPETSAEFTRDIVSGSLRYADGFSFYRPRLTCLLSSFNVDKDEYAANVSWQLELEEV